MIRIRKVEEAIADEYAKQEMRCPVHLYIGQEAIAAGISECLQKSDAMVSTHRSHGHYLAQNGALEPMIAELYGKRTGSSAGKGGSMHLFDPEVGYWGSSAIVGGNIPITAGFALKFKLSREKNIAVAYFGDGATEEGVLYETMNFAALKQLPLLFVCENNMFSVLTRLEERQAAPNFCARAQAFGIEAESLDGNDVLAVTNAASKAVSRARSGLGPTFLECHTYRWRTHCGPQWDTPSAARPQAELDSWKARCPIASFEARAKEMHWLDDSSIASIYSRVEQEIQRAFAKAKNDALPLAKELWEGVLA